MWLICFKNVCTVSPWYVSALIVVQTCWFQTNEQISSQKAKNSEQEEIYKVKKKTMDLLPDAENNIAKLQVMMKYSYWNKPFSIWCIFIRDLQIRLRVRDWVRVLLFNSCFQASHYHSTHPFHPMNYILNLKPTWRTRALETSLVWNSKIVLNLVLVVQSEGPYYLCLCFTWPVKSLSSL